MQVGGRVTLRKACWGERGPESRRRNLEIYLVRSVGLVRIGSKGGGGISSCERKGKVEIGTALKSSPERRGVGEKRNEVLCPWN